MKVLSSGTRPAVYNKRRVVCPNASLLGFSTHIAKPGSWLAWSGDFPSPHLGRMFARVEPVQLFEGDTSDHYIAVVCLSSDATFGSLRWVDPKQVRRVVSAEMGPPAEFLAWLTGPGFMEAAKDPEHMLRLIEYGTLCQPFIVHAESHLKACKAGVPPAAIVDGALSGCGVCQEET